MKNKGLWRKMLAGCLALTLSLSSGMAAFSTEEEPAAPEEAAVEEIAEAVEEEESYAVEEDDAAEEEAVLEAADADVLPDDLIEDPVALSAAEDEEWITITFSTEEGKSRLTGDLGNYITNEYGDYVYAGPSEVTIEVRSGDNVFLGCDAFLNEGFRLAGWSTDDGTLYDWDESVSFYEDTYLTAQWDPAITITFDGLEGSVFNEEYRSYSHYKSNTGTKCEFMTWEDRDYQLYLDEDLFFKEGEVLAGWNGDDGEYYSVCDQYSFTEDITLTADWAEPIEVTLDLGDGVYNNADDPVNDGKSVIVLNKAYGTVVDLDHYRYYGDLEGNKLAGWIVYDADGNQIDDCGPHDEYRVDGPVTLMADWKTAVTVT